MRKYLIWLVSLVAVTAVTGFGQRAQSIAPQTAPARAEVMVLGVYHMSNPGHDIFNTQADDVLAPKRQAEMTQLIEVLKKFNPTKIAVESDAFGQRAKREYGDYLAGKYTLSRNEIDQIGYRLAKDLGHRTVYAVDVDGEFPYQRVVNFAKASGRSKELEQVMSTFGDQVKAQNAYLASHTILETLVYINSDEQAATNIAGYSKLIRFGEVGDWAGADLVADWFRRNVRIYSNIAQLADSPNERVLVIYGAGHLPWLQNDIASNPEMRLRKLAEFVK
jgi:hypothetical protein